MSKFWTISEGHRAITCSDSGVLTEPRKAHPRYTPIDPQVTRAKLEAEGFLCETLYGNRRRAFLKSPRTAIMRVTRPSREGYSGRSHGIYCPCGAIYFDHRGMGSLRLQRGVLRMDCANQFTSGCTRIHHCSEDARLFAVNPEPFLWSLLGGGYQVLETLEKFLDVPDGHILPLFVRSKAPILGREVQAHFDEYRIRGGNSWWSALQALTEPKRRRLDEFASRLLDLGTEPRAWDLEAAWN